jgi:ribulose-phosphate 3-epimerase
MIIPAILETDFEDIKDKVSLVDKHTDLIQIDVADNKLVDGRTYLNIERFAELPMTAKIELDLMVMDPLDFIKKPIKNVSKISSHVEATHVSEYIFQAKKLGYTVGLSINPDSPLSEIEPFSQNIDFVQFLTVVPGGQGRKFEKEVLEKVKLFKKQHPHLIMQVDGGMNKKNIKTVVDAGVDDIVIGSTIFSSHDPVQTLKELQGQVGE